MPVATFTRAGQWGPEGLIDAVGDAQVGAAVALYHQDGTTLATRYADAAKTPAANPWTSDAVGNVTLFADPGQYVLKVTIGGLVTPLPIEVPVDPDEAALDADVAAEASARASADSALQGSIDSEAASRAAGDSATLASARAYTDAETTRAAAAEASKETPAGAQAKADAAAAFAVQRANHTGTQTASTVSDFDTRVRTSRLDQMAAPTTDVPFNSHKAIGLADATADTDAVNRRSGDGRWSPVTVPKSLMSLVGGRLLYFDDFNRPDVDPLWGTTALSGQTYETRTWPLADAVIRGGRYTVPAGGTPHLSTFLQVLLAEVPTILAGEVTFDQSFGTAGTQEAVLVSCPNTATVTVTNAVLSGGVLVVETATPTAYAPGVEVTLNATLQTGSGLSGMPAQALVTPLDPTHFSIPGAGISGSWVAPVGPTPAVTTSLANQSIQLIIAPIGWALIYILNGVRQVIGSTGSAAGVIGAGTVGTGGAQGLFSTPLAQDGVTRYQFSMRANLTAGQITVTGPAGMSGTYTDIAHITSAYWGALFSMQVDIPSTPPGGGVYWTGSVAGGAASKPTVPAAWSQPLAFAFTGDANTYLSAAAASSLSGDLAFVFYGGFTSVVSAALQKIMSQWGTGGTNNESAFFGVAANGKLEFGYSPDGTTTYTAESSVIWPYANSFMAWGRITFDHTGKVNFYSSLDAMSKPISQISWTHIGAADVAITAGTPFASNAPWAFGGDVAAQYPVSGTIVVAQVLDGIGGPPLVGVDSRTPFNGTGVAGRSWALTGSGLAMVVPVQPSAGRMATVKANPTGLTQTTSTTFVMAGAGVTFTPTATGKVQIMLVGSLGSGTAVTNASVAGRYGTGAAPANGDPDTGTAFGQGTISTKTPVATSGYGVPFTALEVVQLTVGTTYWVDLAFLTGTGADAARLASLVFVVQELAQ